MPDGVGGGEASADEVARRALRLDLAFAELRVTQSRRMSLSTAEAQALQETNLAGALGPTDLARRLSLTTGAVTYLADRLAQIGLLERTAHASDRRRIVLRITEEGRERLAGQQQPVERDVRALVAELSDDDRVAVGAFLDDLLQILATHASG